MEVYLRRVYRANRITGMTVSERDGVMSAKYDFQYRDTPPDESPVRTGYMAVLESADKLKDFLPTLSG